MPRSVRARNLQRVSREIEMEVVVDGLKLAAGAVVPAERRGTVLLLHGIPSTMPPEPGDAGYPGLARRFAERGWIAGWVEMRGVRMSEGHFSIAGWVRDARTTLDALRGLDEARDLPAAIVGSSAGGAVAAETARVDQRVEALALLGTPAAWVSFAGDPIEGVRRITEEAGMTVAPEVLTDPAAWAAEFEAVSAELSVAALEIPVLVVHGSEDDVVPVSHAPRIAAAARRGELRLLEGAGHQLRKEPRAVGAVLDWLEEVL